MRENGKITARASGDITSMDGRKENIKITSMGKFNFLFLLTICLLAKMKGLSDFSQSLGNNGAQGRDRTADTRIFSPLLYRLSYLSSSHMK